MLYRRNRIIVGDGLNWVTRPAAWQVDPLVSSSFSTSNVSRQPAFARWYATLAPVMPPPTTTACARSTPRTLVGGGRLLGLRQKEEQKGPDDCRDPAQLDSSAQAGRRRQQPDRLQADNAAYRGGHRGCQLGG